MKHLLLKTIAVAKGLVILFRPHILLGWLRRPLQTVSNTLYLTKWIWSQDKTSLLNDFYSFKRDYSKRYVLYEHVMETLSLKNEPIDYIEFGVFKGFSFKWWVKNSTLPESRFYGFDTFEGLPEDWGTFKKGEMTAGIPAIDDSRVKFIKGLFQDTLPEFLDKTGLKNGKRKVVHLDADLFSSTLFALTSMAPFLNKGDVLIFDEFNVPNHEFFAFRLFSEAYYVKTKMVGAVNNYFQVAVVIV